MQRIAEQDGYELDLDQLYSRMWSLAEVLSDGTRLFKPRPGANEALKWLIQELSGAPADPAKTLPANDNLRRQVHAALPELGWARRMNASSFRLLRDPLRGSRGTMEDDFMTTDSWDIAVGEKLLRRELHDRWGGGRYGGMEPSVKAHSVFLFSQPTVGHEFGYLFDGWHEDGTFHYTGDGQRGDQLATSGGNKALLDAENAGRVVRVFRSEGRETTYLGPFQLAQDPYYRSDATDADGEIRSVIVFRLEPIGPVEHARLDEAPKGLSGPLEIPIETSDIEGYVQQRPTEPQVAVRREAKLVNAYADWLTAQGVGSTRHKLPLPDGGYMYTDIFDFGRDELIEAKASSARIYVRAGLGQVLDYARFLSHGSLAILVPTKPVEDLVELLHAHGVGVIWQQRSDFARSDPT